MPQAWINALLGGAVLGASSALVLLLHGQLLGISGLVGAVLQPWDEDDRWRAAFLAGLAAGGALWMRSGWPVFQPLPDRPLWAVALAGVLVGIGTRIGNGCTSGHGICGCSRLSPRSIVATLTFMATGAAVVALW